MGDGLPVEFTGLGAIDETGADRPAEPGIGALRVGSALPARGLRPVCLRVPQGTERALRRGEFMAGRRSPLGSCQLTLLYVTKLNSKWLSLLAGATTAAALALVPVTAHAQQVSRTFGYTGAPQTFTVPEGVCELTVDAFGAAGGDAFYGSPGGRGGEVIATVPVTPGDALTIDVGGAGTGGDANVRTPARGGYGGGGQPGAFNEERIPGNGTVGGGGGGATKVSLALEPLIIAGGGGGGAGSFTDVSAGHGGDGGRTGTNGGTPDQPGAGGGGTSAGKGGAAGQPVAEFDQPGLPGGDAVDGVGGDGAVNLQDPHMGTGGGGGGGAQGGGAGGSSSVGTMYGGGGAGGSSLGPADATYNTGVRQGDGEVTLTYDTESCGVPPTPTPTPTEPTPTPTEPTPTPTPTKPSPTPCPNEKLKVEKTTDRARVPVGGTVHYRIRVTNTCAGVFHKATFTDDLADVLDNGRLKGPIHASVGAARLTDHTLTWTGDLQPGQTAEITYTVIACNPGVLRNILTWHCKSSDKRWNCVVKTNTKVHRKH